ncbi:transcription factor SPT20 homolog isoform X3 [Danio rerio]|uniref:Transcription factor SPT20 homolog isoform X3 n=4 Tax=Danio rerio TaxID=7955 RepID=A0AC58GN24_DANRE|nr:transcription factor SPT20 homolog isoform X3 [Danio rerio]|eukprot:XP_005172790.1 transcription factor SPT20 homolog isoform X3 [Danio rerio]
MQQVLEYALDRAEYIVESARQRPAKRRVSSSGRKSLYQKLYELYIEECEKEPELKKLRRNVNLLQKLVSQESVSCLVVNLYPGNEGYSLMLRGKNGSDSETIRLRYEEGELLEYLDAEELPPILVDLLEKSQVNIFHCGCVIAEVRDYRQSGNTKMPTYQSRHILLRPTMQTLICDVHAMTSDHKWTQDDKLQLESQLILATAEPLCLDPSISVSCTTNRLLYNKQKMNTRSMKRCFRRHSRAALNRQQEIMSHCPALPQLRLLDYLQRRKERKPAPSIDLKISKAGNCVDMWKQSSCQLTTPAEIDVEKYAVAENAAKLDDTQPTVWPAQDIRDDYTFECEMGGQLQRTKVTIFQSMGDPLVYGKIYSAKDSKLEEDVTDLHLIHPPFLIGSKTDADRFLMQYKEVYERDVKCQVKMLHNSQSQLSPSRENESSVLGKGVKHRPPPIKLPAGSACASSGNPYSTQASSGHLKCPTPPPSKNQSLSRKHSIELGLLSPAALSPMQRSGTPKPSTPTPTNTPCSTPHPADVQSATPSVTPTPQDPTLPQPPTLLTPFAQQQMTLPVMTIPLPTSSTTSSQVMTNPAGLNFINVVGSVCSPQTLMSGSNSMLGCSPGTLASGIPLSGLLPSGGLMSGTLPAMQPAAPGGGPFGLNSSPGLRPLNLLQLPTGPLIFNSLQQQQFSPQQQSSQSATSSPQQQGESADGGLTAEQGLSAQQTAVINLTGVGGFMSPQAAVLSQLGCGLEGSGPSLPSPRLQQQHQPQIQLQFLQHQMQQQQMGMAVGAAAQAALPRPHSANQPKSKRKRSTPQPLSKS